jgi:hypothetical protein
MQCEEIQSRFADLLTGTLDAPSRSGVFDHLVSCAACSRESAELQWMWNKRAALPAETPNSSRMRARFNALVKVDEIEREYSEAPYVPARTSMRRRVAFAVVVTAMFGAVLFAAEQTGLLAYLWTQRAGPPTPANRPVVSPASSAPAVNPGVPRQPDTPGAAASVGFGSIQGTLTVRGTSEPIPGITVALSANGWNVDVRTLTGADGKFQFNDVPPGRYLVGASLAESLGTNSPYFIENNSAAERSRQLVTVQAGEMVRDLAFTFVAGGVVHGQVRDSSGSPAVNLMVGAWHVTYRAGDGRPLLTLVKWARTDDRGNYRLFNLRPDTYYIRAESGQPPTLRGSTTSAYASYYPGTLRAANAVPIRVDARADIGGIDFRLESPPTFSISGVLEFSVPGGLPPTVEIFLVPRSSTLDSAFAILLPNVAPSGEQARGGFRIRGVVPGSYDLVPIARYPVGNRFEALASRIPVEIVNTDLDGIKARLQKGVDVTGRLVPSSGALNLRGAVVELRPIENMNWLPQPAGQGLVGPNGDFTIPNRAPGTYQVVVNGLPGNAFVADMRSGGTRVYESGVTIGEASPAPLEIVVNPRGGSIEGIVMDGQEKAFAVHAVLVPLNPSNRASTLYRNALTDRVRDPVFTAAYSITGIAPGDYRLFALRGRFFSGGAIMSPQYMAKYAGCGQTVRVAEASSQNITLQLCPE